MTGAEVVIDRAEHMRVTVQQYQGQRRAIAEWEHGRNGAESTNPDDHRWLIGTAEHDAIESTPEAVAELVCCAVRRLLLSPQELNPHDNGANLVEFRPVGDA